VADDSKKVLLAGFAIPRIVLYGVAVILLCVGGAVFAIAHSHPDSHRDDGPPAAVGACWDGSGVDRGERCSTGYDAKALYWAFGVDPSKASCERSSSYAWSSLGLKCEYVGKDLRMAVWNSAKWRDKRLLEYGKPTPLGKGLLLHAPGSAGRWLLRYDSPQVLVYASVKVEDRGLLEKLWPHARSLNEMLYGVKTTEK
jgi:hypothetical protein